MRKWWVLSSFVIQSLGINIQTTRKNITLPLENLEKIKRLTCGYLQWMRSSYVECKIYDYCLLHFSIILGPLTYVVKINVETCHKIYMCNIVFLEDEYFTWLCRSVWDPAEVKSLSHPSLTNYNYCRSMMLQSLASELQIKFTHQIHVHFK